MNVILYTTHCPKCVVLEKKLIAAGIKYTTVEDVQEMGKLNIQFAPALKVDDGPLMNFMKAIEWVRAQSEA